MPKEGETQPKKRKNVHHDEDVDEFVPDEEEMTETSEFEAAKGPVHTFSSIDRETIFRIFATPFLVAVLVAIIGIIVTCFYFVPIWDPIGHLDRMKVRIAVQDEGIALSKNTTLNFGEQFMQSVLAGNETKDLLGWEFVTGHKAANYTESRISNDVVHQEYWAGIIIPPDFTSAIVTAYTRGTKDGAYSNHLTFIRDQALQYTTSTIIDRAVTAVVNGFDLSVRKALLHTFPRAENAPAGVVYNPVRLESVTVHTIGVVGEDFSHYVPFVIIWICMMTTMWFMRAAFRSDSMLGNFALTKHKKYMWFIGVSFITAFFVSLCIALFLEGLGVKVQEGVVALIFLYWFTALVFAGILNLFLALLSSPGLAVVTIILIFQLVTSDGIYAAKTMAGNFKGATPAFPFSHAVQLSRTLICGTALNDRGLHVVIMLVWLVGSWVVSAIIDYFTVGKRLMGKVLPAFLKGYYHFVQMV